MALSILIRTQLSSIPVLADVCFTKQNYNNNTNATLSINTPRGVLGGSVAAISPGLDYTVVPCTETLMPVGLFVNDAAGAAFENSPAVASGKIAVIKGLPSVEVDVFETKQKADDVTDIVYTQGDYLYSSAWGLLTPEHSVATVVIGVITKQPTTASPTLGLDQRI